MATNSGNGDVTFGDYGQQNHSRKFSVVVDDSHGLAPSQTAIRKMSVINPEMPHLLHEAKDATHVEKSMTIWQAFKTYPKLSFSAWSFPLLPP